MRGTRHAAVLIIMSLVSGCSGLRLQHPLKVDASDWPTFARDGSRSSATAESINPPLELQWEHDITGGIGNGSPVIVDSFVIIGNLRGELYAINMNTNKRVGWIDLGDAIQGAPVVNGNVAFVATSNTRASLIAFDLVDGVSLWKREYGDIEVSPLIYDQHIYIGNTTGLFFCVERTKGDMVWKFEISENRKRKGIRSSPAIEDSTVLFGADDGAVYALDAKTGSLRWKFQTGAGIVAAPAAANRTVYIGNTDGVVYAIDVESGQQRWMVSTGTPIYASASLSHDLVIVGNTGGALNAMRSADGTLAWTTNLGSVINAGGVSSGNTFYIGTLKKELFAVKITDGSILWKQEVSGRIKTSPAVANGKLFIATDNRLVMAFHRRTQ